MALGVLLSGWLAIGMHSTASAVEIDLSDDLVMGENLYFESGPMTFEYSFNIRQTNDPTGEKRLRLAERRARQQWGEDAAAAFEPSFHDLTYFLSFGEDAVSVEHLDTPKINPTDEYMESYVVKASRPFQAISFRRTGYSLHHAEMVRLEIMALNGDVLLNQMIKPNSIAMNRHSNHLVLLPQSAEEARKIHALKSQVGSVTLTLMGYLTVSKDHQTDSFKKTKIRLPQMEARRFLSEWRGSPTLAFCQALLGQR